MKIVKKILILFINLPIYYFSFFIKRKKNIWIFGSWFGDKYADNSKYLFEYINRNQHNVRPIWLTRDKDTLNLIKTRGFEAYKTYSLKGYFYSLIAYVGVLSVTIDDINMYTIGNMKLIQLWHGTPIKKIMKDSEVFWKPKGITKWLIKMTPLYRKFGSFKRDLFFATSDEVKKKFISAFKINSDQVKITGYPRNDSFFLYSEKNTINKIISKYKKEGKNIGAYMPTHRKHGESSLLSILFKNLEKIDEELHLNKSCLLIKLHYYHLYQIKNVKKKCKSIIFIDENDINQDGYSFLKNTDFLITDYSSIYFDYLIINKPIIFAAFDLENYIKYDSNLYYDYFDIISGPIAKNWSEILENIKNIDIVEKKFLINRENTNIIFNEFNDGDNCKRVFENIINFLKK